MGKPILSHAASRSEHGERDTSKNDETSIHYTHIFTQRERETHASVVSFSYSVYMYVYIVSSVVVVALAKGKCGLSSQASPGTLRMARLNGISIA